MKGGYTGKISGVNASFIRMLLEQGLTPVISPIALSEEFEFLNVDGDRAAAYVAGEIKSDKVLFITNVGGLLMDDKLVTKFGEIFEDNQAMKAWPYYMTIAILAGILIYRVT